MLKNKSFAGSNCTDEVEVASKFKAKDYFLFVCLFLISQVFGWVGLESQNIEIIGLQTHLWAGGIAQW